MYTNLSKSFVCNDPPGAIILSWYLIEAIDAYVNRRLAIGINPSLGPKVDNIGLVSC